MNRRAPPAVRRHQLSARRPEAALGEITGEQLDGLREAHAQDFRKQPLQLEAHHALLPNLRPSGPGHKVS